MLYFLVKKTAKVLTEVFFLFTVGYYITIQYILLNYIISNIVMLSMEKISLNHLLPCVRI